MKNSTIRILAMIITQPLAMYLFLRVLQWGVLVSAGLAALVALLMGFGVHLIQVRMARGNKSL